MENDSEPSDKLDWGELVGKHLLVGITFENQSGAVLRQEQLHGTITDADPSRV